MDIGHFAPGTDSMDSDAEIENHVRTDLTSAKDCQAVLHNWPRWLWWWGGWF